MPSAGGVVVVGGLVAPTAYEAECPRLRLAGSVALPPLVEALQAPLEPGPDIGVVGGVDSPTQGVVPGRRVQVIQVFVRELAIRFYKLSFLVQLVEELTQVLGKENCGV